LDVNLEIARPEKLYMRKSVERLYCKRPIQCPDP